MRLDRSTRAGGGAAAAATVLALGLLLAASPARAVTVQADAGVDGLAVALVFAEADGTDLDPETSVLFDPGPLVSVSASRTSPGFTRRSASGAATLTNLLDQAVVVVIGNLFTSQVFVALDEPGEVGRGEASFTIRRGATVLDRSFDSVRLDDAACGADFPCSEEDIDSGGSAFDLTLAPGEAARLDYAATALAVAPVPVPATLGLSLLGLGALLVARGRRRGATA